MASEKMKTAFFIDGFNVYHFIRKDHLKWLNYMQLAQTLLPNCDIVSVKYFTARATWDVKKTQRHDRFIEVCRHMGVEVIVNKFQAKEKRIILKNQYGHLHVKFFGERFNGCLHSGYSHEEKRTDVAIGVHMYRDAMNAESDMIALMSGDTDFIPALQLIKNDYPNKKIMIFIPSYPNAYRIPPEFRSIAGNSNCRFVKKKIIAKCLLPPEVALRNGNVIRCPKEWL